MSPGQQAAEVKVGLPPCRHYWVIETPTGPTSPGLCRLCGERREFKNYLEGHNWEEELFPTLQEYPRSGRD